MNTSTKLNISDINDSSHDTKYPSHIKSVDLVKSKLIGLKSGPKINFKTFRLTNASHINNDGKSVDILVHEYMKNDGRYYENQSAIILNFNGEISKIRYHPVEKDDYNRDVYWPNYTKDMKLDSNSLRNDDIEKHNNYIKHVDINCINSLDIYSNIDMFKEFFDKSSEINSKNEMYCDLYFLWNSLMITIWSGRYYIVSDPETREIYSMFRNLEYHFQTGDYYTTVLGSRDGIIIDHHGDVYSVVNIHIDY